MEESVRIACEMKQGIWDRFETALQDLEEEKSTDDRCRKPIRST